MTWFDPGWPRLTFESPESHSYQWVLFALHVQIHITSENTDDRKLQALDDAAGGEFRLTWLQLWHHRSWAIGVRALKLSGKTSKRWAGTYIKFGGILPVNTRVFFWKSHRGLHQPPLRRRGLNFTPFDNLYIQIMLKIGFSGVNNPRKKNCWSLSPLVKLIPVLSGIWPTVRWLSRNPMPVYHRMFCAHFTIRCRLENRWKSKRNISSLLVDVEFWAKRLCSQWHTVTYVQFAILLEAVSSKLYVEGHSVACRMYFITYSWS